MHIRTAVPEDSGRIRNLYQEVARRDNNFFRSEEDLTEAYISDFVNKSISKGLIIVAEDPNDENKLIGEIHGYQSGLKVTDHVLANFNLVIHPDFQGKKLGKTLFTIFLEEIGKSHSEIGKVELIVRESNENAIRLFQSRGFLIEGRMEMRVKKADGSYEADIPMGWQNPNFEFD
jgi:ribosomal protein S18 acetylase RimI-like enzyme